MIAARLVAVAGALALAGCNQNTAIGNDREAQLDPVPEPAPVMSASDALRNVSPAIIKPETMSDIDIEALGGREGRCAIILTEVAFPSFLYEPGGAGVIKLNGKLIPLPSTGEGRFEGGGLTVTISPLEEEGNAGSRGMQMIMVPPGAPDEIGYHGYVRCDEGTDA